MAYYASGMSGAEELAASAADAVRRVVSEAESRAEEIVREAEAEAGRIREKAEAEAKSIRERAEADARGQIEAAKRALDELGGTLAAAPQVTNQQGTPFFLALSDSAIRAVKACEPFPLPAPKYEFWRDMILTFKPSDMF